jgi:hypothetical protein
MHDSDRYRKLPPEHKEISYFQFSFDHSHFVRTIKIRILNQFAHCVVNLFWKLVANPPHERMREAASRP